MVGSVASASVVYRRGSPTGAFALPVKPRRAMLRDGFGLAIVTPERRAERQANEAFEAYVHASDDAPICPKIPQGYGVDPGDCACGNCPEAR